MATMSARYSKNFVRLSTKSLVSASRMAGRYHQRHRATVPPHPRTTAADRGHREVRIISRIRILRGERVLIDADLAALYGVPTKRLNEQVKRNEERFPADFMFQLTEKEAPSLRSQFATLNESSCGKHRKYRPWAFTEHGAIMAATVLNSPRAVEMTVYVVRAFVKLRHMLASNAELERGLDIVKRSIANLDAETQRQFDQVFEAILGLMAVTPRQ